MAAKALLLLALVSLFLGLAAADWSILNQKYWRNNNNAKAADTLKSYCESWRMNVELHNIREFQVVPQECVDYIKKYMTGSQYTADSERAIEEVKLYLTSCCSLQNDGKDAWIFDVDDTLLSTVPYFKKHGFGGQKLNLTSLEAWMEECKAPALEPTLKLFNELKDKGIKIFLVSSRRETLRSATVDNLISAGYHGWSSLILRGLDDEYLQMQQFKSEARKKLVDQGYRIWGIIGDQWSSLKGPPKPNRAFKLPNSIYYL
ncbi:Acid phosphatase (Class B) [Corchorus capsularis]|uniref:Acid phosphatase (Class B) n=1 Tax=Corchorus capsularis TaxID=210143 RepID=A0A1R3H3N6_COCAP|nr:Acid phosphatase (Class B) [Corchorus capsularis]